MRERGCGAELGGELRIRNRRLMFETGRVGEEGADAAVEDRGEDEGGGGSGVLGGGKGALPRVGDDLIVLNSLGLP